MKLFHKKSHTTYNPAEKTPVIKCSICTGEQVAGFQDNATKAFEDIMLIQDASDLAHFREMYGIIGDIKKIFGDLFFRRHFTGWTLTFPVTGITDYFFVW